MKQKEKIIGIAMLLFAIGFNLWIYRLEPTAQVDPNDNTFQYALVDRTNQIWDFAQQKCSSKLGAWNLVLGAFCQVSYLADHWVPNWAEGYNLPYYYSHVPQIAIVASYRLLNFIRGSLAVLQGIPFGISLFQYYHIVIYLLLSIFPLTVFLSLRLISLPWLTAGFGALIATQLSTDGLYGLDPASFLWRGYGLSSQLFAMIFLPLAIAYAYKFTNDLGFRIYDLRDLKSNVLNLKSGLLQAIFFLAATTAGHLGIGIIAFLSTAVVGWKNFKQLLLIYGGTLLVLAYWIVPILLNSNYHNISVWDPVWKFDSYGAKETLVRLFNGDLFDFGRLPILTGLTLLGAFACLLPGFKIYDVRFKTDDDRSFLNPKSYLLHPFSFLFVFWLVLYFGRTTWGPLIDLIPGMREFHLSRFIVGLHVAGLFLIPMGIEWIVSRITDYGLRITKFPFIRLFVYSIISLFVYSMIAPQTIRYANHNDVLIKQANTNFEKVKNDVDSLIINLTSYLSANPGRVFAGRGGSWGKDFRVAETPYYMYLSTYGIPTVLWLPQTWSPNSDIEQYFSEDQEKDYVLYNIKYVVTPIDQKAQPFWNAIKESPSWKLYEVLYTPDVKVAPTSGVNQGAFGYITSGIRPAIVSTSKQNFINVVRLWIQSDYHKDGLYPELTFDKDYPRATGLPNFRMLDEVTYKVPDGTTHNLFAEPPKYIAPSPAEAASFAEVATKAESAKVGSQSSDTDMIFRATVDVPEGCIECLVILKQTFHPSWRATIDGKPAQTMTVFPFYTAVKLESSGTHEIVFSYQPSGRKIALFIISFVSMIVLLTFDKYRNIMHFR